ncbi:MAG: recombinase family protein [Pseudonocardiaceae bacterium]
MGPDRPGRQRGHHHPRGAAMTQVLAVFAELERRPIGERTKAALAVKRAQNVTLGRPYRRRWPRASFPLNCSTAAFSDDTQEI